MKRKRVAATVAFTCLLTGGLAVVLLLRQHTTIKSLRMVLIGQQTEIESLRGQLAARSTNRSNFHGTPEVVPPAIEPNAFANIAESTIPGRYKWTQSEQEKGTVTLLPDHTFESHKGERFAAYRWKLSRDRLVLEWNIGSIHYTSVESPGIYVGTRTDGQTERMEKVE